MRVLILGAAGRAGRAVFDALCSFPGTEAVFLADADAEGLSRMASIPAPFPVRLRYLDAADPRSLRERFSEADLVLGCLGPSGLHEREVFRAALDTGRDYLSLCDDADVTAEVLSRREEAAARGSRVLLGCGMAPGLSNLLALRALSLLDRADRLGLFWRLERLSTLGAAALRQLARSLSGKAAVVRGGREGRVRAGGWPEAADFPVPPGPAVVCYLHRPEPLTLHRATGGVEEIFFKAGMGSRGEDLLLQVLSRLEEGGYGEAMLALLGLAGRRGAAERREAPSPCVIRVTAEGVRGGKPRRVHLAARGDYYRTTAAMAAAALAWLRSADPPAGVYTPEEVAKDRHALPHLALPHLEASGARFYMAEESPS